MKKNRPPRGNFEHALDAIRHDKALGETCTEILGRLTSLEGLTMMGLRVCQSAGRGRGDIVGVGVQSSDHEPAGEKWFDWLEMTRTTLRDLCNQRPR